MKRCFFSFFFLLMGYFLAAQHEAEHLLNSGYAKYEEEDYKGAIEDFSAAVKYDSSNAETFYLRGVCYSLAGQNKSALKDLDKATTLKKDYSEAYYEKGYIYLVAQNADKAILEFDQVIKYNPNMAEAYVSRGTAKCMNGDQDGAMKDWKKAEKLGVSFSDYMQCD